MSRDSLPVNGSGQPLSAGTIRSAEGRRTRSRKREIPPKQIDLLLRAGDDTERVGIARMLANDWLSMVDAESSRKAGRLACAPHSSRTQMAAGAGAGAGVECPLAHRV